MAARIHTIEQEIGKVMCLSLFAQEPQGGGGRGAPAGAGDARGGQRGGGGRGGRGTATPAPPRPTGPVVDATDAIIAAINSQDAAFFRTALTQDAILVDEDGHVGFPANVWAARLTSSLAPKKLSISNLMVGDLGESGAWAAFNYTLDETTDKGEPNQMKGSSTIVYSKSGTALKAVLIQLSVNGRAIAPH